MSAYLQHRHSLVLALFAGCCGCDFTPDESGLSGVGEKMCVNTFLPFLDKPGTLSVQSFARELNHTSGFDAVVEYLGHIVHCFTQKGCYYDHDFAVRQLDGCLIAEVSDVHKRHAAGLINPRDRTLFTPHCDWHSRATRWSFPVELTISPSRPWRSFNPNCPLEP